MSIMYAVISYNTYTEQEMNIVGWSDNEPEARKLESQMNDLSEIFIDNASETPLVEYSTEAIQLYGCPAEYQAYGDFDALIQNDTFFAIVPAGWGDHYSHLKPGSTALHCTNILKGFDSYLS